MGTLLRALRLLAIVLWVGGIAFFAFVLAPVAFGRLASTHEAGLVVGGTLNILHMMGLVCGIVFCIATAALWARSAARAGSGFALEVLLIALMLAGTAYSQFHILPTMERDRAAAGGDIATASTADPARSDFERLHGVSEKLEGFVLLCGLGVVFLLARGSGAIETVEL